MNSQIDFVTAQREQPINLVPYDPSWPAKFEEERSFLEKVLHGWLVDSIEHIGSTAVVGLSAKPVIDIMAPVRSLETSRPAIDFVVDAGYVYYPYKVDFMHWFCKPSPSNRTRSDITNQGSTSLTAIYSLQPLNTIYVHSRT